MTHASELERVIAENERLRRALQDCQYDLDLHRGLVLRYQAADRALRERIDHLLDQPLIILNGDAFIGSRDYQHPCPN